MTPLQAIPQCSLNSDEVALCQRVFDHIILAKHLNSDAERQDVAHRIIQSFRHGVKDEEALVRLLT